MDDVRFSQIHARQAFTGRDTEPLRNVLLTLEAGRIVELQTDVARPTPEALAVEIVTPGLIDLQINGAADVQFNHDPTPEGLATIAQGARQGGTALLLPTFTTAPGRDYATGIEAVRAARAAQVPDILGIHVEGPFLSPQRPGIHPADHIRPLDTEDVDLLASAARDMPVLLTLAPECQDPTLLTQLTEAGVILFAGHSEATAEEMQAARAAGLRGATHLFNAMSQIAGRAPGVVGDALAHGRGFAGIIADGHHVHPANLALAARCLPDGLCLVTDAMQTLAGQETQFDFYGRPITLADGRLTGPDGTLAGAQLSMIEAVQNMVRFCELPLGTAFGMASANPAAALGLDDFLGRIAVGYDATLSLFSANLSCTGVFVQGCLFQTTPDVPAT